MTYEAVDNGRKLETGKRAAPSWKKKKDTYRLFDKKEIWWKNIMQKRR